MFKAKQRNRCLTAFQQLGHISFLLMNPSVGFVLAPILHRFQLICRYDLFSIKEQHVHNISEYIIIICQQFLGNIFLCHVSLSFLSGPPLCSYIVPKQSTSKETFSFFTEPGKKTLPFHSEIMNGNKQQQKSLEPIIVSRDHPERQTRLEFTDFTRKH